MVWEREYAIVVRIMNIVELRFGKLKRTWTWMFGCLDKRAGNGVLF